MDQDDIEAINGPDRGPTPTEGSIITIGAMAIVVAVISAIVIAVVARGPSWLWAIPAALGCGGAVVIKLAEVFGGDPPRRSRRPPQDD